MNEQSRLDAFLRSMTAQAEADIAQMQSETDALRAQSKQREKAREEAGEDASIRAARTLAARSVRAAHSRAVTENRGTLLRLRETLTEELFADVRAALADFAASKEYQPYLLSCARRLRAALPQEDAVLRLRAQDMGYATALRTIWGDAVQASGDIVLGGAQACSAKSGLLADESLDARLREQAAWFRENAGALLAEGGEG